MSEFLEFTGERFTPECVREIRYEHVHRYAFARELVSNRRVLDAACGEGYGSALLAQTARSVCGVDVSSSAVEHARKRYQAGALSFRRADCLDLPFDAGEFDCVVSFETLEHLEDHERLLGEFRRVLKPDGFLLISTPDKAIYTDALGNRNEYHVRELYRPEFEDLITAHFPAHRLWGQKLVFQSAIWSLEAAEGLTVHREGPGGIERLARPAHEAVYLIAACAAQADALPQLPAGLDLFDDADESVYSHYHHEIRKNMAAGELLAERDREIERLEAALAEARSEPAWWRRLFGSR
ncbi:MAG: class I SAM-dependent methyltransferase [Xanthomonadales bacterium]|nr:class I SAM-dependent methyltransferase [Xanthomonadales bacterium]